MSRLSTRTLGSSNIEVSELGLGCNRIGENSQSEKEWINMLQRAFDLGVTVFDTSASYTGGRSEELIGKAFANRKDVVIATKVKPPFSKAAVIAGAENSLRALQRDCIDLFQIKGGGELDVMSDPEWAEAMAQLKQQGKVRLCGASVFQAAGGLYAIENNLVDVLQITYNLFDTGSAARILPVADQHGIGLLARMPYHRGVLTGKFSPSNPVRPDNRASKLGANIMNYLRATDRFRTLGDMRAGGMAELAMQYVLAEKRLSCTIPGARSIEQLEANVAAAMAPELTDDEADTVLEIHNQWIR